MPSKSAWYASAVASGRLMSLVPKARMTPPAPSVRRSNWALAKEVSPPGQPSFTTRTLRPSARRAFSTRAGQACSGGPGSWVAESQ